MTDLHKVPYLYIVIKLVRGRLLTDVVKSEKREYLLHHTSSKRKYPTVERSQSIQSYGYFYFQCTSSK